MHARAKQTIDSLSRVENMIARDKIKPEKYLFDFNRRREFFSSFGFSMKSKWIINVIPWMQPFRWAIIASYLRLFFNVCFWRSLFMHSSLSVTHFIGNWSLNCHKIQLIAKIDICNSCRSRSTTDRHNEQRTF